MSLVRRVGPWVVLGAGILALRYAWGDPPWLAAVALVVLLSAYLLYSIVFRELEVPRGSSLAEVEAALSCEERMTPPIVAVVDGEGRAQPGDTLLRMTEPEIRERLARYRFYHIIPLTENISTPGSPDHVSSQQPVLAALRRLAIRGKRVLDVGCRDGLYSFEAERQGAAEVIGIDSDLSRGAVEFLIPFFGSRVRMHEMNLLDLTAERFGRFDVVIFAGVLYHLRYPFQALGVLRDVLRPGGTLLMETAIFYGADAHAMLYCPIGDDSPYGYTCCSFFNRKGLVDTLTSLGFRTLSISCLHPDAPARVAAGADPVIDRAVLVCESTTHRCNEFVERYWHGLHDAHSRPADPPGERWQALP